MAKAKRSPTKSLLDVACSFGNVSIGDGVARLGITIERTNLPIATADDVLCGRRLQARVLVTQPGEDSRQRTIEPNMRHELGGVFDAKSFRVSPKLISTGLSFSIGEIDVRELGCFAKQSGRLIVTDAEQLKGADTSEADDSDDDI